MSAYPTKNQGFSLIEILVSLVVMSIGLMGLSGLQIAAIKAANESHFRNEASLLLMDTANRMRSNNTGMNDNDVFDIIISGSEILGRPQRIFNGLKCENGNCTH
ncbi:MAG TPA: type IV pilus modification protein PilV, partial [Leucothrix mucor]|nr:type IV pilus modification protein PilV [Leucothrix mucor]